MKKVNGWIDVRALGRYDFTFFVDDETSEKEIEKMVDDRCDFYTGYNVDPGYIAETKTETIYRKKEEWE